MPKSSNEIIKCRLCSKEFGIKQLGMHISRTHKIIYENYAKKYWKDLPNWSPCDTCGKICKEITCSKKCYALYTSKKYKGVAKAPRSEQHKLNLSKSAKERFKNKINHPMYGKKHSPNAIKKMSITHKRILENKENHPRYGVKLSEQTKQKISNTRIIRGVAKGQNNPMYGKTHKPESIKKIFSHRKMNKTEKIVADLLDSKNINYHFQFFITQNNICKSYDFKIKNKPIIIEVDGDYWHGGPGVKKHFYNVKTTKENDSIKDKLAIDNGYKLYRFWESDIKKNPEIVLDYL